MDVRNRLMCSLAEIPQYMYDAFFNYLEKFSSEPVSEDDKVLLKKALIPSSRVRRQLLQKSI